MRRTLHVVYPVIPPTSNKLYIRGIILTTKAREYAESFSKYMAQNHLSEISEMNNTGGIFALHLRFFLCNLENQRWNDPRCPPSKRPKSRYKRLDLSNRIKLLEDCVRDALAIDDSQTFAASQEKHQTQEGEQERVEIIVQEIDLEMFGLRSQ